MASPSASRSTGRSSAGRLARAGSAERARRYQTPPTMAHRLSSSSASSTRSQTRRGRWLERGRRRDRTRRGSAGLLRRARHQAIGPFIAAGLSSQQPLGVALDRGREPPCRAVAQVAQHALAERLRLVLLLRRRHVAAKHGAVAVLALGLLLAVSLLLLR